MPANVLEENSGVGSSDLDDIERWDVRGQGAFPADRRTSAIMFDLERPIFHGNVWGRGVFYLVAHSLIIRGSASASLKFWDLLHERTQYEKQ